MAQQIDAPVRWFTAGEALEEYRRVKMSGSTEDTIVYADAGDNGIGVTRAAVANAGKVGVYLDNKEGTIKVTAAGAVTANDLVYPANDGKVWSTVTGEPVGRALDDASGDGSVIEVLPLQHQRHTDIAANHGFFEDFLYYVSTDLFTTTATNSGTATVSDATGGILAIAASDSTAADNDETYVHQTTETFTFANNKPLFFEARVALSEANTDDANVLVGLKDAWAANSLLDNGGGPAASYSGAVFYKIDGGTAWLAECSISTTQTAVTLTGATFPGDGTYQKLGIEFIPTSSTVATVNFYVDGVNVGSTAAFTYTSATAMEAGVGVKNGDTNNETLNVDYITCWQVR